MKTQTDTAEAPTYIKTSSGWVRRLGKPVGEPRIYRIIRMRFNNMKTQQQKRRYDDASGVELYSPKQGERMVVCSGPLVATASNGDTWNGDKQDGRFIYSDQQGNLYESSEKPAYRLPITINRYSEQQP